MSKEKLKKTASFKDQPELLERQNGAVNSPAEAEVEDPETIKRREVLRSELASMTERDKNAKERWRAQRDREKRKAVERMYRERREKGFNILPDAAKSKSAIRQMVKDEEIVALHEKMADLKSEDERIQSEIDTKLGISALPKGEELVALAADFYGNTPAQDDKLPEHIRRALTTEEIHDLRIVFELFDAKNKGYIIAHDLERMASMLGVTAKKKVWKEMIEESPGSKRGRINFLGFLDLMVKIQGDGPDHYEEMKQFFSLLDRGGKGFVTFQDLRNAADELKLPLSNKALRDMMTEADPKGHGKVRLEDLVAVLGQSSMFKASVPPT